MRLCVLCSVQTCTSAFATRDRLRAHLIRHEEKVPCHICGKLLSAAYITDHMRVHNQSQHHACHLCNRSEGNYFLQINISFNGYYFCRIFYTYPTKLSNPSVLIDILILNPTLLFLLCSLSLYCQASQPSPICVSMPRSTMGRSGRRVEGHGAALVEQVLEEFCFASYVGSSARQSRSFRATWAHTQLLKVPPVHPAPWALPALP